MLLALGLVRHTTDRFEARLPLPLLNQLLSWAVLGKPEASCRVRRALT